MYLALFHRFRQLRKKSHAYSNFNHSIEKSPDPNGILKWRSHLLPHDYEVFDAERRRLFQRARAYGILLYNAPLG